MYECNRPQNAGRNGRNEATLRYEVSSTEINPLRKIQEKMYSTYSDACTSQRGRKEAHVCLF